MNPNRITGRPRGLSFLFVGNYIEAIQSNLHDAGCSALAAVLSLRSLSGQGSGMPGDGDDFGLKLWKNYGLDIFNGLGGRYE